jgi:heme a synthase
MEHRRRRALARARGLAADSPTILPPLAPLPYLIRHSKIERAVAHTAAGSTPQETRHMGSNPATTSPGSMETPPGRPARATGAGASADWRTGIDESRRRPIRTWLWSIAAMTLAVLVVGGITRLTLSGLSIVDWQPIMGVIPPLNDAQWQATFDIYRQFPDYQRRAGMTLSEFKFIYFWEYLHRLVARGIGIVFLVPFAFFAVRGYFTRPILLRSLLLFGLGAMQGVMGWIMVMSGLVDRPSVSHYRLAAHLSIAFVIFGYAVWLARELRAGLAPVVVSEPARRSMSRGLLAIGGILALQIVWGAFVAGLKAGLYYNTFPLMGGGLVPPNLLAVEPALRNFVENPVAVQWIHRILGTVLLAAAVVFFVRVQRLRPDARSRRLNALFLALIATQYLVGVLTLVLVVPISLAVIHQAMAMILFGVWLIWLHHVRRAVVSESYA